MKKDRNWLASLVFSKEHKGSFFIGCCTFFGGLFIIIAAAIQADGNVQAAKYQVTKKQIIAQEELKKETYVYGHLIAEDFNLSVEKSYEKIKAIQYLVELLRNNSVTYGSKELDIFLSNREGFMKLIIPPVVILETRNYKYIHAFKEILIPATISSREFRTNVEWEAEEAWDLFQGKEPLKTIAPRVETILKLYQDESDRQVKTLNLMRDKLKTIDKHGSIHFTHPICDGYDIDELLADIPAQSELSD